MNHWHPSESALGGILFAGTVFVSLLVWLINRHYQAASSLFSSKGRGAAFVHAAAPPLQFAAWYYFAFFSIPILFHFVAPQWEAAMAAHLHSYFWHLGLLLGLFWFLYRMVQVVEDRLAHRAAHTQGAIDDFLVPVMAVTLRTFIPLFAVASVVHLAPLPASWAADLHRLLTIAFILSLGWITNHAILNGEKALLGRLDFNTPGNEARAVQTRVRILRKFAVVFIWLLAFAAILMLFQEVRTIGKSLLASAGIAGLALTFAANQSLSTLFAGLQLAFTQPIRLGDQVIVQGESGTIEEITFTYVVVRLWDLRRLVVPITFFIQQPFQNWSRGNTLITTVKIRVDFSMPVEALRQKGKEIVTASPRWDKNTYAMHVTDADAGSMELRIIASAETSAAFDLQCEIREKLLAYIHENHSQSLAAQARVVASVPPAPAAKS